MMSTRVRPVPASIPIREVQIDGLETGLVGLQGVSHVLVIFRFHGQVVGQALLPVQEGSVPAIDLQEQARKAAWPVWKILFGQERAPAKPLPAATVVVCTRDRTTDLARCLPGLSRIAKQGHQVIVVDNCPAETTTATLVAAYPEIEYLLEPRPGLDIARNRGLRAAAGEIIAFTDDDAQVEEGWLDALRANFDDPLVAVVTGLTLPQELETNAQQWFERSNTFERGFARQKFDFRQMSVLGTGQVGAGVNMAIRRSALGEIGLFDEALDAGTPTLSGGDQEFFSRVLTHGYQIIYEPAALVWHRHRREWSDLRRTMYAYGVGVFAWWTRALLVDRELSVLIHGPAWFWQHHLRNLIRALLQRNGPVPLDLAWAEFKGALAGPASYLRSRRWLSRQNRAFSTDELKNKRAESLDLMSGNLE